jgi:hypothetical protein
MALLATSSYPSPIDTFSHGNFFFFLANSSIADVGSAPALNRNNIGSNLELSYHIVSIGYEIGSVNAFPSTELMN